MRSLYCVLLLCLLSATDAGATTALPITDEALLSQATAVAQLSVLSVAAAPGNAVPSTDHIVLVEHIFKGRLPGTTIIVRLPGGVGGDGVGLHVDGLPRLAAGDRLVAFLAPRDDGTFGVLHLGLGLFLELQGGPYSWAVRLTEIGAVDDSRLRALDRWTAWLERPGDGAWRSTLARAPEAVRQRVVALRESRVNAAPPWAAGGAGHGDWAIDRLLAPRVIDAGRAALARAGIAAPGLAPPPAAVGLAAPDARSWLAADVGGAIPGRFDCDAGGLAVLSATRYRLQSGPDTAAEPLGTTLLVQDGAECLAMGEAPALEEILGSELTSSRRPRGESTSREP